MKPKLGQTWFLKKNPKVRGTVVIMIKDLNGERITLSTAKNKNIELDVSDINDWSELKENEDGEVRDSK